MKNLALPTLRWWAAGLASGLLSGCLSSTTPAFDETNSVAALDSPELRAIFMAMGKDAAQDAAVSAEDRVMLLDGMVLLQNWDPLTRQYSYLGYALLDGRPAVCTPASRDGSAVEVAAAGYGVQADVADGDTGLADLPAIAAEGEPAAMTAFIRDLFTNQPLACVVAPAVRVAATG